MDVNSGCGDALWLLLSRDVLVIIFAVAVLGKLLRVRSYVDGLDELQLLPRRLHHPVAWSLVGAETLTVGLLLAGGAGLRFGLALGALLLASFTAVLSATLARGLEASCGCFGATAERLSWFDVGRNVLLLGMAIIAVTRPPAALSGCAGPLMQAQVAAVAVVACLLVVFVRDVAFMLKAGPVAE